MMNGATPISTAIVASVLLRRIPGRVQIAGLVAGMVGVVLIAVPAASEGSSQAFAIALLALATISYGFAINLAVPLQQRYGAAVAMAQMLALATVMTAPLGVTGAARSTFAWGPALAVLALGTVGTGFAFRLMGTLTARVGGTRASFVTYVVPAVALVEGVVLRGEAVAPLSVLGVAMVIAGAVLASRADVRARPGEAIFRTPPNSGWYLQVTSYVPASRPSSTRSRSSPAGTSTSRWASATVKEWSCAPLFTIVRVAPFCASMHAGSKSLSMTVISVVASPDSQTGPVSPPSSPEHATAVTASSRPARRTVRERIEARDYRRETEADTLR
jgi:hypothetical protein